MTSHSHSRRHFLRAIGASALVAPLGLQACLDPNTGLLTGGTDSQPDAGSDAHGFETARTDTGGTDTAPDLQSADDGTALDARSDIADAWDGSPPDTWDAYETAEADVGKDLGPDSGQWPVLIGTGFSVFLADKSCSGHPHVCQVPVGEYWDNTPVELQGGHPIALRPLTLKALESGKQVPFHTLPGGGHHHCGTAVHLDVFNNELDGSQDALDDFFECVVPEAIDPETPEPWASKTHGPCVVQ